MSSSACSSREASPAGSAHGAHRHVLPGRLHLPAPLMALIGMFFQDGLPWQRRSGCSSACSSRAASPAVSAHGAHRHVLPGGPPRATPLMVLSACSPRQLHLPAPIRALSSMFFRDSLPWQRHSWCSSACSSRAASIGGSAHGAHRHVLQDGPLGQCRSWCPSACSSRVASLAGSAHIARRHVLPGTLSRQRMFVHAGRLRPPCLLMALIGMPFQGG